MGRHENEEENVKQHGFATRAIHDGQPPDAVYGAVNLPIYLTSTYAQEAIGKDKGYDYSRAGNPTRTALEETLASLEGGTSAHVFGSGMAAIMALVTLFKSGDHVICGANVYGGVPRLFNQIIANYGISFTYVDTADAENVRRAIKPNTRLVHIESPTNPLMTLTDIRAVADVCRASGVELSVDNTFLSPYFQRPIELGADIVMHSTTKFLNGHSDGIGGVLVVTRPEHKEQFDFVEKATGAILSPFECWMIQRGVKTLAVRMRQHDENGRAVAAFLDGDKRVQKVFYPGLAGHPQHELAKRQQTGFGSMLSIELGSFAAANAFVKALKLCTLGESLGGVETLVSHPATMTHAAIGAEARAELGITDGMVRISVGIEDADDLIGDLDQALGSK
ncbi:MAG TPA: PLP-dependent aspartate aminotransferase family protein [Acidisarcina sp.]